MGRVYHGGIVRASASAFKQPCKESVGILFQKFSSELPYLGTVQEHLETFEVPFGRPPTELSDWFLPLDLRATRTCSLHRTPASSNPSMLEISNGLATDTPEWMSELENPFVMCTIRMDMALGNETNLSR